MSREWELKAATQTAQLQRRSPEEFANALAQGIKDVEAAKGELARLEPLSKDVTVANEKFDDARRTLESAERKYQIIIDDYLTDMRDLAKQLKQALADLDAAEHWLQRVDAMRARVAVPPKTIQDAKSRMDWARLTLERLKSRYELFKAAGGGLADGDSFDDVPAWVEQFEIADWGLRLMATPIKEGQLFAKTKYRGGMRILNVAPGSLAAKNGLQTNDVLVGLDKWETRSRDNITWIVNQVRGNPGDADAGKNVKFFIVRGQEVKFGFLAPLQPDPGKHEVIDEIAVANE